MKPLLIVIASLLALAPAPVLAAPGLTPYVQRVIERARAGETAIAENGGTWGLDDALHWLQNSMSAVFGNRETAVTRTDEVLQFTRGTACLQTDLTLILQEMENVRRLMAQARADRKSLTLLRLMGLYEFLGDRMRVLEWGSSEIAYSDPAWSAVQTFDTPEQATLVKDERLCPFSTRYADISLDRTSGCTPKEMENALAMLRQEAAEDGAAGISALETEKNALSTLLDSLQSTTGPSSSAPAERQMDGCTEQWPAGYRSWSPGAFAETAGIKFLALTKHLANIELLRPSYYQPETWFTWNIGINVLNPLLASDARDFATQQARSDALVRIGGVETRDLEEAFAPITKTVGSLARLVSTISAQGDQRDDPTRSLRDFVRDAAYFLRRSCMNRDCNASLERVMRIVTSDACFPYTSGGADLPPDATQAQKDQKVQELRQACARQAGVDAAGL